MVLMCATTTLAWWWLRLQVAINWCMAQGTVPIPGAKTLSQASRVLAQS
jgi:hypothetical protein